MSSRFRRHLPVTENEALAERGGASIVSASFERLIGATGHRAAVFSAFGQRSGMDSAAQLQFLVSGNNQFGRVTLGRTTATQALKKAHELLELGYMDVRIYTPRGQILQPDEFDRLEG
jgi:hypothetical protein